jgi:hypothetical protein
MKLFTIPAITAAVCALTLATAPKASALIVAFEYTFTADPGQSTAFNGSTIILRPGFYNEGIDLVGWNLVDSAIPGFQPLTINNSSVTAENFFDDSTTTWDGTFTISGSGAIFDGANADGVGSLDEIFAGDPPGTWSPLASSPVPDVTNSAALLTGALGILVTARRPRKQLIL